ncbi:MAG: hypothetical protein RBS43_01145 [Candidatus Cloacimonas sp.]|jgi:hypothetical protein|nr:hypothetical protein [Candidatus Cloacimonas sp.]
MSTLTVVSLILCCLETLIIILLIYILRKTRTDGRVKEQLEVQDVLQAFEHNGYNINNLTKGNLEEHIRTFKLQVQNEDYTMAENRVVGNMSVFVNELWRLKREDKDNTAINLIILLKNTLGITLSGKDVIVCDQCTKQEFDFPDNNAEGSMVKVRRPALYYRKSLIAKGVAR